MPEPPLEIELDGVKYIRADEVAKQMQKLLKESIKCDKKLKVLEKQLRERWCYDIGAISDIHAGDESFDAIKFNKMLFDIRKLKIRVRELHVLGDIIEGKLNHRGQDFNAFPIDIQQEIALRVLRKLIKALRPEVVHILPGNHDMKHSINLIDSVVYKLEKEGFKIVYHRDEVGYGHGKYFFHHGLKRFYGSDYTAITPQILNNIVELARIYHPNAKVIVMGHYHKPVDLVYMGKRIVLLPSFQWAEKPLRNTRGMTFIKDSGEILPLFYDTSKKEEIKNYWKKAIKV